MSTDSTAVGITIVAGATTVGAAATLANTGSPILLVVGVGLLLLIVAGIAVKKSFVK
jgi:hypothetical protein